MRLADRCADAGTDIHRRSPRRDARRLSTSSPRARPANRMSTRSPSAPMAPRTSSATKREYVDVPDDDARLGSPGHTLVLENNPASLAIRAAGQLDQPRGGARRPGRRSWTRARTSCCSTWPPHGGNDHSLLVDMDPIPLDQLDPEGLAEILGKHAFRWKVAGGERLLFRRVRPQAARYRHAWC